MDFIHNKPRLAYFQYKYDERLAKFLLIHKREHVECLARFFDVTVISEDCDYQEICDKYQPDLTLVESGVPFASCRRPNVSNRKACPHIPKLGLLHSDAFSEGRAGFLSDMDHWGIDTFFAIATTAAEHMPEIKANLFTWPVSFNGDICRDYGQSKSIPVLFTGSKNSLYPWRHNILRIVSRHYPSLICPHPGYTPPRGAAKVMIGESYARMLNSSWFVPACGTVAKEVVRKHFEIPACRACLVTEKSPALEAAGFVDMNNCVFADEDDVLDKLAHLFEHPEELDEIIDAGHQMVHSRHELKHRDEVFQWFTLSKHLKANQEIVQTTPFQPLSIVDRSSGLTNAHVECGGLHLALLREGDEKLWSGHCQEAEQAYFRSMHYYRYMPEPLLRLAICNLYKGDVKSALTWIVKPLQFTLAEYKAIDPDPVEWAYFIVCLLCDGRVGDAAKRSDEFPWLHHPELDRARWVTNVLRKDQGAGNTPENEVLKNRLSVHGLPDRRLGEWVHELRTMLKACGQSDLAETVTTCLSEEVLSRQGKQNTGGNREVLRRANRAAHKSGLLTRPWVLRRTGAAGLFRRGLFYTEVKEAMKRPLKRLVHSVERRCGYFLPYRLSEGKRDEFFNAIQSLAREENIKAALIVGAALKKGSTEALLAGARENRNKPSVFCLCTSAAQPRKAVSRDAVGKWSRVSLCTTEGSEQLATIIAKIKCDNRIDCFDMLVIDGHELREQALQIGALEDEVHKTRFVVLDDINNAYNDATYSGLLTSSHYVMLDQNPGLRNGYAIFERVTSASGAGANSAPKESGVSNGNASTAEWSAPADCSEAKHARGHEGASVAV